MTDYQLQLNREYGVDFCTLRTPDNADERMA